MYINNNVLSDKAEKSALFMRTVIFLIFLILFFAFWNIQILKHNYYNDLALGNISDSIDVRAPRGVILDKNNIIIAENKIKFILYLNRNKTEDMEKTLNKISKLTERSYEQLKKTLIKFNSVPRIRSIPLVNDLSFNNAIYIKSHIVEFNEFDIEVEPDRKYPLGQTAAHILGYMSEISEKDLKNKVYDGYILGDKIGKSGIEKEYEMYLNGQKGKRDVLKNNLGVVKQVTSEKTPIIGNRVFLTIDIELQRLIEGLLIKKNLKGTVGVVDLKTGGILALVSKPGFNPHSFWNIYPKNIKTLNSVLFPAVLSMPYSHTKLSQIIILYTSVLSTVQYLENNYSLHNKFIQGRYSPGSVFKIVMTLAGLEENIIDMNKKINCLGVTTIYKRPWHCWKEYGHGIVDLNKAIKDSCNIYFYNLGKNSIST